MTIADSVFYSTLILVIAFLFVVLLFILVGASMLFLSIREDRKEQERRKKAGLQ